MQSTLSSRNRRLFDALSARSGRPPAPVHTLLAWLAAGLIAGSASPLYAATFYVDRTSTTCSNSGAGTEAQPYCSISAAVTAHGGPGTTILVKPGVYPEQVTIGTTSGIPGSPLLLRAAGSGVVVDGADDFSDPARWVRHSGDVWFAASVTWTPLQVFADGARLAPSTTAPASLPSRTFRWVPGEGLYVHAGGGNPAGYQARVGRRNYGMFLTGTSWITIDGFTVTGTQDRGIYLAGSCANVTLTRNTVTFANKMGIQVSGGSGMLLGSNTVSDNNDHGIALIGGVSGSTLEDNESFRNALPTARAANGIYLFGCPGNVLRRNRLHDNQDTGIHLQSGSNNCVSYLNRSWSNGDHGYDHLGATGTIHVCDVAYGNLLDGFSIEGNATGTQLHNCIATENGLTTDEFDLWVDSGSASGFVSNYNLFWNSTSQPPVKFIHKKYSSVADYSAASGQDARSLQANPRFVNPAVGDFHLLALSPAIDNANSAAPNWPSTDAEGRARVDDLLTGNTGNGLVRYADRGAFEYRPGALPNLPPATLLTVAPALGVAPLPVSADASGSTDLDGAVVSYRFDFGDGAVVGPQPGATANHIYAPGIWTCSVTATDNGGLSSTASAAVVVTAPLVAPHAVLTVTPSAGNAPLLVTGDASESSAGSGAIVSYRFDFGDGTLVGPQPGASAAHTYAAGQWTTEVLVTDEHGLTDSASVTVEVAEPPACSNLIGNPSFEAGTQGWNGTGCTIQRVAGGSAGSFACRVTSPAAKAVFGLNDSPDWIRNATAGQGYRFKAWVRSSNARGIAKIKVREYRNGTKVAEMKSPDVTLWPTWQPLEVEYVVQQSGSTIDLLVSDSPVDTSEVFEVDDVSICPLSAPAARAELAQASEDTRDLPAMLAPSLAPNPVVRQGTLRFSTSRPGPLDVGVFDVSGRRVQTILRASGSPAGLHVLPLDDRGEGGSRLDSGIYFYRIHSVDGFIQGRFVLMR